MKELLDLAATVHTFYDPLIRQPYYISIGNTYKRKRERDREREIA